MSGRGGEPGPGPLTDEQRRPLEVEGASIALSAGAGCGKTRVLTERFLRDLDGPARRPLRSVVALTFTEKAARELRQRIRAESRRRLDGAEDVLHWRSVLRGLEAAPIGTFHQFCGTLLRRHAVTAGLDPEFSVLDESIAATIRDEALGACVRGALAEADPDLIELGIEFGLNRVREALRELISRRDAGDLDAWESRSPAEIVATWKAAWVEEVERPLLASIVERSVAGAGALARNPCTSAKQMARYKLLWERLLAAEREASTDDWRAEVRSLIDFRGAKSHWASADAYEEVKEALTGCRDAIDSLKKARSWDEATSVAAAEHGLRYVRLALKARRSFDAAKRARGGLDYDDLLLKARDLLRAHAEAVRSRPEAQVGLLLVDEFQDTDPVQAEILEHLSGEAFPLGRLFVVGDMKQSIYRFRGARPEIFNDFRSRFPAEGHRTLAENFRSTPGVIDFVNALFHGRFPGPGEALKPSPLTPARDDLPAVEFLWADEASAPSAPKGNVDQRRRVEARWIAGRLRVRLEQGWMIRDRKTGVTRPAEAGDVAILFRAMTNVGEYERAFADEGFDYHVVGGSAFYVQQEVTDLANVLSAIEDPFDDVALAAALRSPFFCLSDDALFWLAERGRGELVAALRDAAAIAELSATDLRRAERALALLSTWRETKDRGPIAGLVDRVLDESGYEAALLGERLGDRKRANARKLVRMARAYDAQGGFTLADFVSRLRADLRKPPREEQAATTDEEGTGLRLMSIHQAKGLEFPIVVIPDLNRGGRRGTPSVTFDGSLGPIVRPAKDGAEADPADEAAGRSVGCLAFDARERRQDDEETIRLFYVAATRARDFLILSAGMGPEESPTSPALTLVAERFDRRTGACKADLPEGWTAPRILVTVDAPAPSESELPRRRRGPRLRAVSRTILQAPVVSSAAPAEPPRAPRFIDLGPDRELSPAARRLDRLVRATLADPRAFRRAQLAEAALRAGRRQAPAAHAGLVEEAVGRLAAWAEGPLGREIAAASKTVRDMDWTLSWPGRGGDTVFVGRLDLGFLDREGRWQLVGFSDAAAREAPERLRLLLSAHIAAGRGFGPVARAWLIRLGPGGGLKGEERFDEGAVEEAVAAVLSDGSAGGLDVAR